MLLSVLGGIINDSPNNRKITHIKVFANIIFGGYGNTSILENNQIDGNVCISHNISKKYLDAKCIIIKKLATINYKNVTIKIIYVYNNKS